MQALHRLAGVQDASDLSTASSDRSRPSHIPEPPPIPENDTSSQHPGSEPSSRRASRASIPIKKSKSDKSLDRKSKPTSRPPTTDDKPARSQQQLRQQQQHDQPPQHEQLQPPPTPSAVETSSEEEFEWGPSHPCFPHPNPHGDPTSPEATSTRVIRIKRDWLSSGDLCPQYANLYPEILDPLVTDAEFRNVIGDVNRMLSRMFDPLSGGGGGGGGGGGDGKGGWNWTAIGDLVLGGLTGWVWDDLGFTGVKKGMKELEAFVDAWNESKRRKGRDVKIVQLRRTGFMSLDIVIPDPGLDAVAVEE